MQNQLNGSGGRRQAMSSIDFYRRVPKDLTEVCDRSLEFRSLNLGRSGAAHGRMVSLRVQPQRLL